MKFKKGDKVIIIQISCNSPCFSLFGENGTCKGMKVVIRRISLYQSKPIEVEFSGGGCCHFGEHELKHIERIIKPYPIVKFLESIEKK